MKNENGFTLVEVLASLVIITIILLSFSRIFIQSNEHANTNTQKLVVTHLADAYLEHLKVQAGKLELHENNIASKDIILNEKTYIACVKYSQTQKEKELKLQNILVQVREKNDTPCQLNEFDVDFKFKGARSKVEGYIAYE